MRIEFSESCGPAHPMAAAVAERPKRAYVDYDAVAPNHRAVDQRLQNWARWVSVRGTPGRQHPMWAKSRSNSRQWYAPEPAPAVDGLDAQALEKAVAALPQYHAAAIRWAYVFRTGPAQAVRALGVTREGLAHLVRDARQMLINRGL